jgi:hypothetical protein
MSSIASNALGLRPPDRILSRYDFQEISNGISDLEGFGRFFLHYRLLPGRELLPELLRLHFKLRVPPFIAVKLNQRPRLIQIRAQRVSFAAVAGNVLAAFNDGRGVRFG